MTKIAQTLLLLVAVLAIFLSVATANGRSLLQKRCSYSIYIQTGNVQSAGTPSKISLTLTGDGGQSMYLQNIEDWGKMGVGHNYFEKGQLDHFKGDASCIGPRFCKIFVVSDGTGSRPGWYLQSVMVSYTNNGSPTTFNVGEWLQSGHWSTTKSKC